jgi:hypothetical protein
MNVTKIAEGLIGRHNLGKTFYEPGHYGDHRYFDNFLTHWPLVGAVVKGLSAEDRTALINQVKVTFEEGRSMGGFTIESGRQHGPRYNDACTSLYIAIHRVLKQRHP